MTLLLGLLVLFFTSDGMLLPGSLSSSEFTTLSSEFTTSGSSS
jgi:hypothetical protein